VNREVIVKNRVSHGSENAHQPDGTSNSRGGLLSTGDAVITPRDRVLQLLPVSCVREMW
jgi:hypothetical protein